MNFEKIEANLNMNVEELSLRRLKEKYPSLMTADELLALPIPETDWIVPDLIPAGLSLIGGAPKVGKSYFILKLTKDILNDGGNIFYLAGEDSDGGLQFRLKQLGVSGNDLVHHRGREGQLVSQGHYLKTMDDILSMHRFDAVFLDNMQMVLPPKSKGKDDYAYYYEHLPQWAELAVKHKCAIVMVHHAKKADGRPDPNPLESILGSTAITGACDTIMVLQKSDDGQAYTLHVTGKFTPDKSWNMVKKNGLFEIDEHAIDAARKRNKAQDAIYNLIKENAGIKQFEIAKKLNKQTSNVSRDVKKLLKTGHLLGSPSDGYTIAKTP
ncbi:MAG: AAA family ATPase [Tateyamaria sp.]|jgi:hypothetical protein|nr:AAA family ATPase [Tateyamaria sp.]